LSPARARAPRALAPRLALLAALACGCAGQAPRYAARPGDGPEIRVLIAKDEGGVTTTVTAPGGVQVRAGGATLAFTQITISCVNCHKVLREAGGEIDGSP